MKFHHILTGNVAAVCDMSTQGPRRSALARGYAENLRRAERHARSLRPLLAKHAWAMPSHSARTKQVYFRRCTPRAVQQAIDSGPICTGTLFADETTSRRVQQCNRVHLCVLVVGTERREKAL